MNRKQDRASTPEESLRTTLDAVTAQPAAANGERLTRAMAFRYAGADATKLFSVNAGVPVSDAFSLAECLLCHLSARLANAVGEGDPIEGDEAYALELLVDIALSLYASTGAHA